MAIKLTFLGTSQAVPTAKRNHTSILLRYEDEMILIDCGEGTQRQFRIADINPCKITRILITHWHGDHVLGIPGLLQTLALNGYNKTLNIYGPKGTKRFMDMIYELFVFTGGIRIEVHEVEKGVFINEEKFSVESFPVIHGTPCVAYRFSEKERRRVDMKKLKTYKLPGPLIGKIQKGEDISFNGKKIKSDDVTYLQEGKIISFILDTKTCDNCFNAAKNSDILVIESTYSSELGEKAEEYKHLTSIQSAEIAKKSHAKRLFLTHLSQRYEKDDEKLLKEAKKVFSKTELAKDFMEIEF
jgi:ribonuclease Z